jgi:citrate/tricarballylate utilization protein
MLGNNVLQEAQRQFIICNACRYCEGYCAVFPAMELRQAFTTADIIHLAHLCHDCRACYYACMYAPPHEFAVNLPRILSQIRLDTYQRHTWPPVMRVLHVKRTVAYTTALSVMLLVTLLSIWLAGPRLFTVQVGPGAFYRIVPQWFMLMLGMGLGIYWMTVWSVAGVRFWRESGSEAVRPDMRDLLSAIMDIVRMRWLGGGEPGCPYPAERPSQTRRVFHSLVLYGFLAAFASTTSAAIYQEILGRLPPYPLLSLPVVLGTLGGLAMIAGCAGLWWLKHRSDKEPAVVESIWTDYLFLFVLGMTSLTGMLTLLLRETSLLGITLSVHLGFVAALYVTGAHGKFIHSIYRTLALIRNYVEQRKAAPTGIQGQ